jgi:hypothetical protein
VDDGLEGISVIARLSQFMINIEDGEVKLDFARRSYVCGSGRRYELSCLRGSLEFDEI